MNKGREKERERGVCVCVCVRERERERERKLMSFAVGHHEYNLSVCVVVVRHNWVCGSAALIIYTERY